MILGRCGCGWSRRGFLAAGTAGVALALGACDAQQMGSFTASLVSPQEEARMGEMAFAQIKQQTPRVGNAAQQRRVQAIAARIIPVSGSIIPVRRWEVVVFDSDEVNAFALPGGKIGVFRGILKLAGNDDAQIATVIGHEVGHVTARHAAQRIGAAQLTGMVQQAAALGLELGGVAGGEQIAGALGLGAQFGVLMPFSRAQELEADRLGVFSMAKAGYDPRQALRFWQKMARLGGGKPPELLSTHPADAKRIAQIEALLPQAETLYRPRAA